MQVWVCGGCRERCGFDEGKRAALAQSSPTAYTLAYPDQHPTHVHTTPSRTPTHVPAVHTSGFADQNIPGLSDHQWLQNVRDFLRYLTPGCGQIAWLHSGIVRGDLQNKQSNARTYAWNRAVEEDEDSRALVAAVIDLFDFSKQFRLKDNLHHEEAFFTQLAPVFPQLDAVRS
jgi:hypothetical protein